ncbi:MAG TPA: restriction endonuclease subunit S, partial [Gammaproteobacteria bacterium]|nr:restriction endonuclease subunit S [Gammaproteobacteria bacterium]
MTDSWETGVLGNYVSLRSGGTPSKARADFWSGTNPWISAKDMKSYWIDGTEDTLSSLGAEHATRIVPAGTTLILVRGMTLHKEIPICRTRQPSAFNQDVKAVIPINGLDNDFLPYLLLGNKAKIRNIVDSAGHGTGRIDSNALLNMQVQVPPPEEQCRIAQILGTLDDKIDLNRHMNQTLESIARALFKSWFVDFDPVRAKAEGRDTGLPKYIADVFPDRLIHCKRGDIPEGWRYDDASSVATIGIGKTPPRKEPEWFLDGSSGVPWISIRDMGTANTFIRETSESLSDSAITKFNIRRVPPGAVLLSFKLTIGRVAISACELVTNEAIAHFVLPSGSTLSKE